MKFHWFFIDRQAAIFAMDHFYRGQDELVWDIEDELVQDPEGELVLVNEKEMDVLQKALKINCSKMNWF